MPWRSGNRISLLDGGEEYFPRVFARIRGAAREVLIETFILADDKVGQALRDAMLAAAARGVRIDLTVDGYGSADLQPSFLTTLTAAGVRIHIFDPQPRIFGMRVNVFRRMHRKLVAIDGAVAFVGGINFSEDHLLEFGPEAKEDYAIEIEGPLAQDIRELMVGSLPRLDRSGRLAERIGAVGTVVAKLITRDNRAHRRDIEKHYCDAVHAACHEVIIANAYFFPGFRLLRELRNAARRGVAVSVIVQGNPDMAVVRWAAVSLYDYLLRAGVRLYEFCERPLHGKVAVVDDSWATIGSSNLDPLSLFLNLEANVVVDDSHVAGKLRRRLQIMMRESCNQVHPGDDVRLALVRRIASVIAFHLMRHFPSWAGWFPAHKPVRRSLPAAPEARAGGP